MRKKIVVFFLLVFAVYNIIWYFGAFKPYYNYRKGIPEIEDSGAYVYVDDDKYQYSVKLPTYLRWNGNLAIADENLDYALIIWLKAWSDQSEKGVILTSDEQQEQIELKSSEVAVDSRNQKLVDDNKEKINILFTKAKEKWKLDLY